MESRQNSVSRVFRPVEETAWSIVLQPPGLMTPIVQIIYDDLTAVLSFGLTTQTAGKQAAIYIFLWSFFSFTNWHFDFARTYSANNFKQFWQLKQTNQ